MPLTPADVHNVAFSKPPIGKRGYNEDEVDAFLDLVENELTRLVEENADLRQRVASWTRSCRPRGPAVDRSPPRPSRCISPSPNRNLLRSPSTRRRRRLPPLR